MLKQQTINYCWLCLFFQVLIISSLLTACGSTTEPTSESIVKPPEATPTLEPTFTASPPPAETPTPASTDTPTPEPTAPEQANLSGRIFDQYTNQPIAEAQVSAGTSSATTDADGRYMLTGLSPGQYVLSVTHSDYDPGLSSIFTVATGEQPVVDVALYEPDTSPYPEDPLLTNPLDPNGAPTADNAERLAREQGLTGDIVSIRETKLTGEYLVNYKIGDEIRAAVAEINHDVWEITDETGRQWWIIKVCGNLASPLLQQAPIATPAPKPLPPMAEVLVDGLVVRECAAEECSEIGTVPLSERVEVFGCLADRSWCKVGWSGGSRGWCTGESLGHLAVAEAVPVVTPDITGKDVRNWIAYLGLDNNIWLVDPITGEQKQLTNSGEVSSYPGWSPDGSRLAFGIGGYWHPSGVSADIAIIDLTTGEMKKLGIYQHEDAYPPIGIGRPAWSPDGAILYYSVNLDPLGRYHQLRMVRLHGEIREETPSFSPNWVREMYPAFSPDGRWMTLGLVKQRALVPVPDSNWGIWLAEADGHNLQHLTVGIIGQSTWSPDSTQIAYDFYAGVVEDGIYVVNLDGTNKRQLTENGSSPTWSPDGQQLAFARRVNEVNESYASEIWLMNSDGTNQQKLTDGSGPAWRQ